MTGNPIFGPKLAPKPLKLPKIRISRAEIRRKSCDPSKEPQCTNHMAVFGYFKIIPFIKNRTSETLVNFVFSIEIAN